MLLKFSRKNFFFFLSTYTIWDHQSSFLAHTQRTEPTSPAHHYAHP